MSQRNSVTTAAGSLVGVVVATLVALVPATLPSTALAGFNAPATYALLSGQAQDLVVGNFGGGHEDVAVSTGADIELLTGNGDGTFSGPTSVATVNSGGRLVTADFNGDSKPDLAVTVIVQSGGYITGSAVDVFLGNGNGTFTAGGVVSLSSAFAGGLAAADFNGDGKPDLAVGAAPFPVGPSELVEVFLGNGDGTFTSGWSAGTSGAERLAQGDFNGDGVPDVVAGGNGGQVTVLQTGTGSFAKVTPITVSTVVYGVAAVSLTGGPVDIEAALGSGGAFTVLKNDGSGNFAAPVFYGSFTQPQAMATPDLNLDGHPDIALADIGGAVETWGNVAGGGTFAPATTYPLSSSLRSIAVGAFNGDTNYDLAVGDGSGDVEILLGNYQASPPFNVVATAGVGSASVSWSPPADTGGSVISGYTIQSSAGGSVSVANTVTSVTMLGVSLSPQTFTVTANTDHGTSVSAPSNSVTPQAGGTYNALTPARILDTRYGIGAPVSRVAGGQTLNLQVTGEGEVPSSGVGAVILNVTVTNPAAAGYVTLFPTGGSQPLASNVNYVAKQTVPNLVEVAVGAGGQVSFYVSGGSTDLIADVQGWVGDSTDSYSRAGLFNPLVPARILDTRSPCRCPLGPGQTLTLQVTGRGGVPSTGVSAVVMNVTVTGPTASGYLTVYPKGATQPVASNLNFSRGQTVPNRVVVGVGTGGQVSIFNPFGTVNVIADVNGWFTDSSSSAGGAAFVGIVPERIFDTRSPCFCPLGPGDVLDLYTTASDPPSGLVLNVTAVGATRQSYLTLYPDNGSGGYGTPPLASDLNFGPGQVVPNLVVVKMGPGIGGSVAFNVYNSSGVVDVVLDEDGFYGDVVPAPPASATVVTLLTPKSGKHTTIQSPPTIKWSRRRTR